MTQLSPAQAALRLQVTPATVRNYCRRGELKYEQTALGRLIDAEDVERLAQERRQIDKGRG